MSLHQRHIKKQSNTYNEVSYAHFKKPTTTATVSAETMETNEEKAYIRQTSQNVYAEPRLAEDSKTKRSKETTCFVKTMESKTVGFFT